MKRLIPAVLCFLFCAAFSNARRTPRPGIAPPPRFPAEAGWAPTLKSAPVSSLSLGAVRIVFDKTTLGQAMEQIQAGKIQHRGDAGESTYWLCYSARASQGWEQIWLLSHGEMGGDEHVIYGAVARFSHSRPPELSCPALPVNLRPVRLDNGLWLGARTEEAAEKLGSPSSRQGNWLHYQSKRELAGDPRARARRADTMYENASVSLNVVNGKVVELWATKQASD